MGGSDVSAECLKFVFRRNEGWEPKCDRSDIGLRVHLRSSGQANLPPFRGGKRVQTPTPGLHEMALSRYVPAACPHDPAETLRYE